MRRRIIQLAALGGGLAVVLAIAAVAWFLGRSSPAGPDLDTAAAGLAADGQAGPDGIDGVWTVAPGTVEDSFVGYRVEEVLSGIGSNTAVARTPVVAGTVEVADGSLVAATVTADLTELSSDDSRRDGRVAAELDVAAYPETTFTLTQPVTLPEAAGAGEAFEVMAAGELAIREVSRRVEVTLRGVVRDAAVVVVGTLSITFADYGVEVPDVPIVLSAEDHGLVELQLFLVRR